MAPFDPYAYAASLKAASPAVDTVFDPGKYAGKIKSDEDRKRKLEEDRIREAKRKKDEEERKRAASAIKATVPVEEAPKPGYLQRIRSAVADPWKKYGADIKEAIETPVLADTKPYGVQVRRRPGQQPDQIPIPTHGQMIGTAALRGAGLTAGGLNATIGSLLGGVNEIAGGIPGKVLSYPIKGYMGAVTSEPVMNTIGKLGTMASKEPWGQDLYKFGSDPTVQANAKAITNALPYVMPQALALKEAPILTKAAEAVGKKVPGLAPLMEKATPQTIAKATTDVNVEEVVGNLPKSYREAMPGTTTKQKEALGGILDKYNLRRYIDPKRPDVRGLEDKADELYRKAYERADEALNRDMLKSVTLVQPIGSNKVTTAFANKHKVNPIAELRKKIESERAQGQEGLFQGDYGPMLLKKSNKYLDDYWKEYDKDMTPNELLGFKRKVLTNNRDVFNKSIGLSPKDQTNISVKKMAHEALNDALADYSPDFRALNQEAKHLKAVTDAAKKMKNPALQGAIKPKGGGTAPVVGAITGALGGASTGALGIDPWLGSLFGSFIGAPAGAAVAAAGPTTFRVVKEGLERSPNYRLGLLGKDFGKDEAYRMAAKDIKRLSTPIQESEALSKIRRKIAKNKGAK